MASDHAQPAVTPTSLPGPGPAAPLAAATLPSTLTRFIGRDAEIAAIAARLLDGVRLLTLTGPGGVGKTRLAIEVAARLTPSVDLRWFIPLAVIRDPTDVVPAIMRALDRRPAVTGSAAPDELRMAVGERTALLVLDNFEHIIDAGPIVTRLLAACPSLTILVTSRIPLHVTGEQLHAVAPLTLPHTPDAIAESEAIRLFVDRASAVMPSLTLTPANATAISEICRRLDGLPLAIELAAARLGLFSPSELLARMDAPLALLRDGAADQPDRLRSLEASIRWSHDLLLPTEQALFARLSVFVGGWSMDAAATVAGADVAQHRVEEALHTLILSNLVRRDILPDGTSRYSMLETIREFAADQLTARGEQRKIRDRHARWALAFAAQTRADPSTLRQLMAIGPLEQEHANIRAALTWLDTTQQQGPLADLVIALEHHWEWNTHEVEGLHWYQRAFAAPHLSPDVQIQLSVGAAFLAHKIDSPLAEPLIARLATLAQAHGTARQRTEAYFLLGMHAEDTGDYDRAQHNLTLAREQADRLGETWLSLQYRYHLGVVALGQGELDQAMDIFAESRTAAMAIDDSLIPAWCLLYQALIWCARADPARAVALLHLHPDMNRTAYRQHEPLLRAVAGVIAGQLGQHQRAARLLGSASHDVPMRHPEKDITDHTLAVARAALGERVFAEEHERGNRLQRHEVQDEIVQLLRAEHPAAERDLPHQLSPREIDVLRLIVAGNTDRQVADALSISPRTAEWHARNVLGKLGAANRAEAAALAIRDHLL